MKFLLSISKILIDCSLGYCYFSKIDPGTHILPHCGASNLKLRCHLPILVPETENSENCQTWIRVGDQTRSWKEGEILVFDDSFEHEVKNDTLMPRVVLIFDIWHPELLAEEIGELVKFSL